MTHGQFVDALQVLLQRGVTGISGDAGTIAVLLNRSYQYAYQLCLAKYPWFYVWKEPFSAATSIDLTTITPEYRQLASMDCPLAATGTIRIAKRQEYPYIGKIPQLTGTTDNPIAVVNKTTIAISPVSTGTLYYYRKIPTDFGITSGDLATNITTLGAADALIHPAFENIIISKTMIAAYARHMQSEELTDAQRQEGIDLIIQGQAQLQTELEPLVRWKRVIPES
jgi:hypothetical protein